MNVSVCRTVFWGIQAGLVEDHCLAGCIAPGGVGAASGSLVYPSPVPAHGFSQAAVEHPEHRQVCCLVPPLRLVTVVTVTGTLAVAAAAAQSLHRFVKNRTLRF